MVARATTAAPMVVLTAVQVPAATVAQTGVPARVATVVPMVALTEAPMAVPMVALTAVPMVAQTAVPGAEHGCPLPRPGPDGRGCCSSGPGPLCRC
jgi:hypothetical protein